MKQAYIQRRRMPGRLKLVKRLKHVQVASFLPVRKSSYLVQKKLICDLRCVSELQATETRLFPGLFACRIGLILLVL